MSKHPAPRVGDKTLSTQEYLRSRLAEVERQNRLMRAALKELSALPFRAPKDVMAGTRRKEIAADALAQLRKRKAAK